MQDDGLLDFNDNSDEDLKPVQASTSTKKDQWRTLPMEQVKMDSPRPPYQPNTTQPSLPLPQAQN